MDEKADVRAVPGSMWKLNHLYQRQGQLEQPAGTVVLIREVNSKTGEIAGVAGAAHAPFRCGRFIQNIATYVGLELEPAAMAKGEAAPQPGERWRLNECGCEVTLSAVVQDKPFDQQGYFKFEKALSCKVKGSSYTHTGWHPESFATHATRVTVEAPKESVSMNLGDAKAWDAFVPTEEYSEVPHPEPYAVGAVITYARWKQFVVLEVQKDTGERIDGKVLAKSGWSNDRIIITSRECRARTRPLFRPASPRKASIGSPGDRLVKKCKTCQSLVTGECPRCHVPAPAKHPSDERRTATCRKAASVTGPRCADVGPMKGIGTDGLCATHALILEHERAENTRHNKGMTLRSKATKLEAKPLRVEAYERPHAGLAIACHPGSPNPVGWERK